MIDPAVIALARQLYGQGAPIAPHWDQLGGVTQGVWIERARALMEFA